MILYNNHRIGDIASNYYYLFLDDERTPNKVTWVNLPSHNWVIVRNYNEFVNCIETYGIPLIISYDHDLGNSAYKEYFQSKNNKEPINYNNIVEKTGRDCALFLANYCLDKCVPIPLYYIHSMNGLGGANIFSIMESARKIQNGK